MSMQNCSECGKAVSTKADKCPHCGAPVKKKAGIGCAGFVGILVLIFIVLAVFSGGDGGNSGGSSTPDYQNDESMAWIMTQDFVEKRLKSPSSAEFPWSSDVDITRSGNSYTIDGYVDAQNTYGADIRENFVAKVRYDGEGKWSLISLEFD